MSAKNVKAPHTFWLSASSLTTIAGKPAPTKPRTHDAKRAALDLDLAFDLKRPIKHAGRNSTGIWGVNRHGCRFSRPAPWMARGGGPPNSCRITGTPSLGEVPSVGARAFCLLLRCSKVSRRKGGTQSSCYPNNGYVPGQIQHPGRLSGRLRRQASSHIWIAGQQLESGRLSGRLRRQASSHIWIAGQQLESGRLSGRLRRQASSHIWIAGQQLERGRLSGRHRRQAGSYKGFVFTKPGLRPNTSTPWAVACPVVTFTRSTGLSIASRYSTVLSAWIAWLGITMACALL